MEKLLKNVTRIIEEEYDKVMLDKSENIKDHKDLVKTLLKIVNGKDTPLGMWTSIYCYMSIKYGENNKLQDKIGELERKFAVEANKLGL